MSIVLEKKKKVTPTLIQLIKGCIPDEENGGRIVDGVVVGPKTQVNRWQIGEESKLFTSRREAEIEVDRRAMKAAIFGALKLKGARQMSQQEVIGLIMNNSQELKDILQKQRFKKFLR
jgi:hypothetical protein